VDYSSIQLSAYNSIKDYGVAATLTISTQGTYSIPNDSYATSATNYATYGLITEFNWTSKINLGLGGGQNDLVKAGDKQLILPAYGLPRIDSNTASNRVISLSIAGKSWGVIGVNPIEPGGTAILFKCVIRGL